MPQLSALSTTPPFTSATARLVACCDDPHWASTVVAATSIGMPALSHAVRAMLNVWGPTWPTQPPMTWPIDAGSMPLRWTAATCTAPRSSAGCSLLSPPLRLPSGDRTASTMTTSVSCSSATRSSGGRGARIVVPPRAAPTGADSGAGVEDDLPERGVGLHERVRVCRRVEREHRVDDGPNAAVGEQRHDVGDERVGGR